MSGVKISFQGKYPVFQVETPENLLTNLRLSHNIIFTDRLREFLVEERSLIISMFYINIRCMRAGIAQSL
jgi:hypothetical protein